MQFHSNEYYHLYNRTNNDEALFRCRENYLYFLKKYRFYNDTLLDTIAYCLMPTHYHFLVEVKQLSNDDGVDEISSQISRTMQVLQSSYTKAINKKYDRHGALFQSHFKSKHIQDKNYFISLITYIHQNPIRSKIVEKAEEWEFSSFQDYIDLRNGTLHNKKLLLSRYSLKEINNLTNKK